MKSLLIDEILIGVFAWRAVEKQMNLTLKSISPVKFHYDDGLLKITNRSLFRHLTCTCNYKCKCLLFRNFFVIKKSSKAERKHAILTKLNNPLV